MSKSFWFLFAFCIISFSVFGQEPDSVRVREITTGFYGQVESMSQKLLSSNKGYGLELGVYQERKILGQVGLSYGAGFGYRSYRDTSFIVDTSPDNDTTIIDYRFRTKHEDFKFSTAFSIKFEYISNPKIYLLVGFGPQITFRQKVAPNYLETRYLGIPDEETGNRDIIGSRTDDPPVYQNDDFKISAFNLRFDFGFGIELKKFNIEIVNRTNNVHGIGIRLKYKFDTLVY